LKDYMDPFEYIEEENIDEKLEIALENPYSVNFRSNEPDIVRYEPEDRSINEVEADLANRNVSVRYDGQEVEEKYVVIMKRPGLAMVKSHTNVLMDSGSKTAVAYHVVTREVGLMYDGDGYTESATTLPRETAIKAPELLERARQLKDEEPGSMSELEPSGENERSSVPTPRKDPLFED
jgi:hypothetical protein